MMASAGEFATIAATPGSCPKLTETITTSASFVASAAQTAVAPVLSAEASTVSGAREFAIETSCPTRLSRSARIRPMLPAPMMPILMPSPFAS
jgi:anthranilate phosphoribosyltransferase